MRFKTVPRLPVRAPCQGVDPHMPLEAALQRGFLVGGVLGDVHRTRDGDVHRVESAAARLDLFLELGYLIEDLLGERMLAQQHVVAALGDLANRARAAGAHPERRARLLRRRRLDDDVVELPVFAAVRERRLGAKSPGEDIERLLEPLVGFLHRHTEPSELVVAIALADPEIEPAAR